MYPSFSSAVFTVVNSSGPVRNSSLACKLIFMPVLRIWDVYPGSRILIFTYPGSKKATKERGEKFFVVIPFFAATNFTILKKIYF
jgi:hypothetical protein